MKPRYSKRTVDEAVQLLDVYASQAGWGRAHWDVLDDVAADIGTRRQGYTLAFIAFSHSIGASPFVGCQTAALEATHRLREWWRP